MNRKSLWILLALLAVAAVILLTALLHSGGPESSDPEAPDLAETSLDETDEVDDQETEYRTRIDPATGLELEEDELPIMAA